MKKLITLLLSVLMIALPIMASAEAVAPLQNEMIATISLPTGDSYTVNFGTDAAGEFVLKTNIEGTDCGVQIGNEVAYICVSGMNISIPYSEVSDIISKVLTVNGQSLDSLPALPEIDMESTAQLGAVLAEKIMPMIQFGGDETTLTFSCDLSFAEIWNACGDDIINWFQANRSLLEFVAASSENNPSPDEIIEVLTQLDSVVDQIDLHIIMNGSVELAGIIPTINFNMSVVTSGSEAMAFAFALDSTGISITVGAGEQKITIALVIVDDSTVKLLYNGEEVITVTVVAGSAPIEPLTDGSDAIPVSALLGMLG